MPAKQPYGKMTKNRISETSFWVKRSNLPVSFLIMIKMHIKSIFYDLQPTQRPALLWRLDPGSDRHSNFSFLFNMPQSHVHKCQSFPGGELGGRMNIICQTMLNPALLDYSCGSPNLSLQQCRPVPACTVKPD